MDFTLSLAHFCELHGPTSVLCTQVLPTECGSCLPSSPTSSPPLEDLALTREATSYFSLHHDRRPASAGQGGFGISDGDRCASCRMSLPDDVQIESKSKDKRIKQEKERHPLRTREDVHVCSSPDSDSDEDDLHYHRGSTSVGSINSDLSCHNHRLEYVSSSSPADSEAFSSLRRATVRTLSGEQLPRGQTSGPLWFGDPSAGYTIAYVFRLADMHARGRQRYYALLALAGTDTQRAFEACSMIWALFEQIAMHIVRNAEEVAGRNAIQDSPPERSNITPISSFLTGRTMDPDGFPRRGAANVRASGIAELVDNENFFCELHVMFVGMLQELGRLLGGMKVKPVEDRPVDQPQQQKSDMSTDVDEEKQEATSSAPQTKSGELLAPAADIRLTSPIGTPGSMVSQRRTVVV